VATDVSELQAPHQHCVESGARHDAQLALGRYRLGEPPVGYGYAHATLDQYRVFSFDLDGGSQNYSAADREGEPSPWP
jgi:hypothetical protein